MIAERCERSVLAVAALLGAMALVTFGRHVWNAGASRSEPLGLTVRSEFRAIYAPREIIDFARAHPAIATNDELVRLVREARLEAWFGVVFRCYQDNGDAVDIALAIRPGEKHEDFGNTRGVLSLLAGEAVGSPPVDPTDVEIEVIEDVLMSMGPVEGLRRVPWRGPGRRLADDSMPRPVRADGPADGAASDCGPTRESLQGAASITGAR
jgi:hypothetical protein